MMSHPVGSTAKIRSASAAKEWLKIASSSQMVSGSPVEIASRHNVKCDLAHACMASQPSVAPSRAENRTKLICEFVCLNVLSRSGLRSRFIRSTRMMFRRLYLDNALSVQLTTQCRLDRLTITVSKNLIVEAKYVLTTSDKIKIMLTDRTEKISGCCLTGQHPVMQFNNQYGHQSKPAC